MANNEVGTSPSVVVDDSGRLRVLNPETNSHSRLVAQSCGVFQSKLQHFQNLVKQLLDQAGEKAQQIEDAKLSAVGMRNMVSAEIESRPQKLRDQGSLIADKQEHLESICSTEPRNRPSQSSDGWSPKLSRTIAPSRQKKFIGPTKFMPSHGEMRLNAEYESLVMVKQEQDVLIARLSDSSLQV